jgi:hypothetical protein
MVLCPDGGRMRAHHGVVGVVGVVDVELHIKAAADLSFICLRCVRDCGALLSCRWLALAVGVDCGAMLIG